MGIIYLEFLHCAKKVSTNSLALRSHPPSSDDLQDLYHCPAMLNTPFTICDPFPGTIGEMIFLTDEQRTHSLVLKYNFFKTRSCNDVNDCYQFFFIMCPSIT